MPYQPIVIPAHVDLPTAAFLREQLDGFFEEFRFLLTVQKADQGFRGSLQLPLAMLLLAAIDGAAKFLEPGKMGIGARFQSFLNRNYPWDFDPPDGLTSAEACAYLWHEARCPMLHAFGNRAAPVVQKYGRIFATTDDQLTKQEQIKDQRVFDRASIQRDHTRTVVWIDALYLGLRIACERAVASPNKASQIAAWIRSGDWDHR